MTSYNREALLKVIQEVSPAIGKSEFIIERSHIWFSGGNLYAFDGGLGIRVALPAASDWACGVAGRVLLNLLRISGQDTVSLDLVDLDLVLTMGKSSVKLASLDIGRRPWPFPAKITGGTIVELTEEFMEAFKKASLVKTTNPDYTIQYGVVLASDGDDTLVFGTDKKALVRVIVHQNITAQSPILLPWAFIKTVREIATTPAKLHILPDCLMLECGATQICSSRLTYPEDADLFGVLESHLPAEDDLFTPIPTGFKPVLDRANILGGEADLNIEVKGKNITVRGSWAVGSILDTLPIEQTMRAVGCFTANYILKGLEYASRFFASSRSLVLSDDMGDFIYVVGAKQSSTTTPHSSEEVKKSSKRRYNSK